MSDLNKIFTAEFIDQVINDSGDVDEIIEILVTRAHEKAKKVETLEKLEGKSVEKGKITLLKRCPMIEAIKTIKEKNFQKTGKKDFPDSYKKITVKYIEKYPNEAGVLHPFCIVHQVMREIFAASKNMLIRHIACQTPDGKIAISNTGKELAGLSEKEVRDMIKGYTCSYLKKSLSNKDSK